MLVVADDRQDSKDHVLTYSGTFKADTTDSVHALFCTHYVYIHVIT